jgi:hypothetical protein
MVGLETAPGEASADPNRDPVDSDYVAQDELPPPS